MAVAPSTGVPASLFVSVDSVLVSTAPASAGLVSVVVSVLVSVVAVSAGFTSVEVSVVVVVWLPPEQPVNMPVSAAAVSKETATLLLFNSIYGLVSTFVSVVFVSAAGSAGLVSVDSVFVVSVVVAAVPSSAGFTSVDSVFVSVVAAGSAGLSVDVVSVVVVLVSLPPPEQPVNIPATATIASNDKTALLLFNSISDPPDKPKALILWSYYRD